MAEQGNGAAMREALEEIDKDTDLLDIAEDIAPDLHPSHSFVAVQIRKIARAALSAPPRNCDVGTAEEQTKRLRKLCEKYKPTCRGCPCYTNIHEENCWLKWAQMPYREGEANG